MKRFTETNKWNDPWYMGLSPTAKHLWQYLLDHCDNAGVVEPNAKLASFQIGEPVKHEHFTELGDRIKTLPNGKLLIPKFIGFQFGSLSRDSRVHGSVFKLLEIHGIAYPIDTLSIPYVKGNDTLKDKEKEKDTEKEGGKGGNHDPIPIPECLKTAEFVAAWETWMNYRRGLKKPGNWATLFQEQLKWLSQFNSTKAVQILSQSMRNGWTGLFEPRENMTVKSAIKDSLSVHETRTILEAKQKLATELKNRHCNEGPLSTTWSDKGAMEKHSQLRTEIKRLTTQLASMA